MISKITLTVLVVFSLAHSYILAVETQDIITDKWILGGTYGISQYSKNPKREKSYYGSSREQNRVFSFLPSMTIIFDAQELAPDAKGYVFITGITQSGIPVKILKTEASRGIFSKRKYKDVVIHLRHKVCVLSGCTDANDMTEIGSGFTFNITQERDGLIWLENFDELEVVYSDSQFNEKESEGELTRHKGRKLPRYRIFEGYASKLSRGCGNVHSTGAEINLKRTNLTESPKAWSLTEEVWDIKAAELMKLGTFEPDGLKMKLTLNGSINEVGGLNAVDVTVFAVVDKDNPIDSPYFFALYSTMKCNKRVTGQSYPAYVESAILINSNGQEITLPNVRTRGEKEKLFNILNRSFLYSINVPADYFSTLRAINEKVGNNHLANIILSRLNASCSKKKRSDCYSVYY